MIFWNCNYWRWQCEWLTIQFSSSAASGICSHMYGTHRNCTYSAGSKYVVNSGDDIQFLDCYLGDATCKNVLNGPANGWFMIFGCTIEQSDITWFEEWTTTYGQLFHGGNTFINAVPTWTNGMYTTSITGDRVLELVYVKLAVNEGNNLEDCTFSIKHKNIDTFRNANYLEPPVFMEWLSLNYMRHFGFEQTVHTDSSGEAFIWVLWKFSWYEFDTSTVHWLEMSEVGGGYAPNEQYELVLSKEGYEPATTDLWGSSDQTWAPTLVSLPTATIASVEWGKLE